jgi:tetratricopeptide (TPR) repeat protein
MPVQPLIRELKTDQLARSLKTASPEIMNKFLANMSQGGSALLKEEMEFGSPVTDEQIEQERQNIVNTVKKLESEGRIQFREKKKISIFESEDATSPLTPSMPEDDFMNARRTSQKEPAPSVQDTAQDGSLGPAESAAAPQGDAASYLSYGSQLHSEEKFQEAIPYLQYVIELDQTNVEAYQTLGNCYYSLGMTQEALQCYEVLLALTPQDDALRQWVEQFKQNAGV